MNLKPVLTLSDVPAPDAPWRQISEFALTFDGYAYAGGFDSCAWIANNHNPECLEEVRAALFFMQRAQRGGSWDGSDPDGEFLAECRTLIGQVRGLVEVANASKKPRRRPAASWAKPELVIFSGPPACGKSSYFRHHFIDSHIRINLDMLRTRTRERALVDACLGARQSLVIDNTNLSQAVRAIYIILAHEAGFTVTGYSFQLSLQDALARNSTRERAVPAAVVRRAFEDFHAPRLEEGFDSLFDVRADNGEYKLRRIRR